MARTQRLVTPGRAASGVENDPSAAWFLEINWSPRSTARSTSLHCGAVSSERSDLGARRLLDPFAGLTCFCVEPGGEGDGGSATHRALLKKPEPPSKRE